MGILAECPYCHTKQKTGNKTCKCGSSMDQAKKAKKVKYWISYRMPNGKQRRESVDAIKDLKGMDVNYIIPTDMTLTKAMDQYTKWLDSKLSHQSGDQVRV